MRIADRLDIALWDLKMIFVRQWRRLFPIHPPTISISDHLMEAAKDWTPYAEVMAERFDPVIVNAGTPEKPESVCLN